ncbi:hypothetical protein A8U91_03797 [Halomonas elongata]|uniref:Uncharacterized protein n=1 Tax=Halomonas elongata TaxID=2746 RepID=A0A1B8NXL4_HALEL|nr:hypothetical protein A8U91_03797 [Halomonas elongata]
MVMWILPYTGKHFIEKCKAIELSTIAGEDFP